MTRDKMSKDETVKVSEELFHTLLQICRKDNFDCQYCDLKEECKKHWED